jgi:hypothetical protein
VSLFYWIDKSPGGYWSCALFFTACLVSLAVLPLLPVKTPWSRFGRRATLTEEIVFCFLIFLTIFAFRWVFLFFPRYFNPDEAAFVMGALALEHDPIFWRSIALGTSGPLNGYVPLLPSLFGFEINYTSVRIIALLLVSGACIFLNLTARNFLHSKLARLVTLGPVAFFALTHELDYIHFSSEHVPLFLLAAAAYFICAIISRDKILTRHIYLAGLMLGSVPLAKLQGVPPAGFMAGLAYIFLLTRPDSWRRRLSWTGYLTLGGATSAIFFFSLAALGGSFGHALHAYLGANSSYAEEGGVTFAQMIGLIPQFLTTAATFKPYFNSFSILAVAASAIGLFSWKSAGPLRWIWCLALLNFLGAYLAVLMPGRLYEHYLLFLVIPTAFLLQASLSLANIPATKSAQPKWRIPATILLTATIAAIFIWPFLGGFPHWPRPLGRLKEFVEAPPRPVIAAVQKHAEKGDLVGLWGWMYEVCAEAGLVRATSNFVLEHAWIDTSIPGRPNKAADYKSFVPPYYFDLFLEDMKRNQPKLFVDAVSPVAFNFRERHLYGYETFPELAAYIQQHYQLVEEVDQVRIFRRID